MTFYEKLNTDRNLQFWTLQIFGWGGWMTYIALRTLLEAGELGYSVVSLADAVVAILVTTILRHVYRAVWEKPVLIRLVTVLVGTYLAALIWNMFKRHMEIMYFGLDEILTEHGSVLGYYVYQLMGLSFYIMLAWSGLYFGIKFYLLLQIEKEKAIKAQSRAHEAQLRMLRYQLNPHFLFNTLNAISTLILDQQTETANAMVSKLSNFLRYSLDKDPMQKVDLDHEVNTMKLYLEIEQVRFEDRLRIEFDIQEQARKAVVPSLLLQPLVENSIKYAVANRETGGTIEINAKVFAGDLLLEVVDDGPGIRTEDGRLPEFTGVGIANTRERLNELYGDLHSCRISEALPHGLKIEIRIPFETE